MVEEGLTSALNTQNVISGFGVFGEVILYVVMGLLIIGLVYLLYYMTTFKNKLIIRDIANGRKIITIKRWKERRGKDSNIWLVTPFNKIKKPLPPAKAIELTGRGRKIVEAYRGEDTDTLVWIEDSFDYQEFKESSADTFKPLTTQERELLIAQVAKAHSYKKKSTWEMVMAISLFMAPVIMIAIIGLTLGDITEALSTYSQPITSSLERVSNSFVEASNNIANIQTPDVIVNNTGVPN